MGQKVRKHASGDYVSTREVLGYLLIGGVLTAVAAAPYLAVAAVPIAHAISKKDSVSEKKMRNIYRYLVKRNYIVERKNIDETISITLSAKGKRRAFKSGVWIPQSRRSNEVKKWDRKWRLLMYDIPTAEGAKRRTLQRYVRHLGFHQLQKSVWVYPFECREDVGRLVRGLGIHESECRLVTVTDMGDDRSLRAYFGV